MRHCSKSLCVLPHLMFTPSYYFPYNQVKELVQSLQDISLWNHIAWFQACDHKSPTLMATKSNSSTSRGQFALSKNIYSEESP